LKRGKDIVECSPHFKNDEYCVRRWEGVGSDDEDVKSWLIGDWTYHERSKVR
jgi:hypothetical protein